MFETRSFPRRDEKLLAAVVAPFVYDGDQESRINLKKIPRNWGRPAIEW